ATRRWHSRRAAAPPIASSRKRRQGGWRGSSGSQTPTSPAPCRPGRSWPRAVQGGVELPHALAQVHVVDAELDPPDAALDPLAADLDVGAHPDPEVLAALARLLDDRVDRALDLRVLRVTELAERSGQVARPDADAVEPLQVEDRVELSQHGGVLDHHERKHL